MVVRLPSVESIVTKLVVLGSDEPALTRSWVLMFRSRVAPQGAQTSEAMVVVSLACQLSSIGPVKLWVAVAVCGCPWK